MSFITNQRIVIEFIYKEPDFHQQYLMLSLVVDCMELHSLLIRQSKARHLGEVCNT